MITMTVKMMMVIMMMKMITMKEYDDDDDDDEDDFIFAAAFLLWCRPQYLREPLLYIHRSTHISSIERTVSCDT